MGDTNMNKNTSEIKVKILSKKLIKPLSQTPDHLCIYKLSLIDQLSPSCHMPVVFFYPADENVDAVILARRLEQLEKSLSESLSCYYPLAGRLAADALSVDCQDQGVIYMVAKVDCQLNQFLDEASKDMDLLNSLAPGSVEGHDSVSGPLVRVQISIFECGGIALAKEIHHTVADGLTAFTFVDVCAKMSRGESGEAKFPSFDLGSIFPALETSRIKPPPPIGPGAKLVAKRLLFDGAAIASLKDQVMARAPCLDGQPSKVEVVTAITWSGLIRAAQARHGYLRPSMIAVAVNLRGKTAVGVQENAFGNMYIPVPIKFMADESKMELYFFVRLIRDTIRKTKLECARASKDELSSITIRAFDELSEWFDNDEVDQRISSSLCRFPLYEADFGWGKPSWVSVLKFRFPMFMMTDTKCGTGIEVFLTLDEFEMQKLERDPYMAPFISSKNSTSNNLEEYQHV